jgi:hypothetical protein
MSQFHWHALYLYVNALKILWQSSVAGMYNTYVQDIFRLISCLLVMLFTLNEWHNMYFGQDYCRFFNTLHHFLPI